MKKNEHGITKGIIKDSKTLKKWLKQNDAEIIETVEGVLLDSYLVSCKNGMAAVYEHYATPNSSNYYVEFSRGTEVETDWYEYVSING